MIQTICVCGAGTMGAGIAQAAAQRHIPVILYDLDAGQLETARARIGKDLEKLVAKKKINREEHDRIEKFLRYSDDIKDCIADIIIEAIVEKEDAKCGLFNQLADLNHSETIFASNSSSLSISAIAGRVKNPERVAGMHFFNPATIMPLVEVIRAKQTQEKVIGDISDLAIRMGKTPVQCKDAPGFIVNHVARPYYLEALRLVESGQASPEQIDELMEATGFRMGPFRLMDLIGIDINYAVSVEVYEKLGRPQRLEPSLLQEDKVAAGELGRKTGRGFYSYTENRIP